MEFVAPAVLDTARRLRRRMHQLLGRDVDCQPQLRLRAEAFGDGAGAWHVAPELLEPNSTVYSFGIGDDISFEAALAARMGVTVHMFDPTPRALSWLGRQPLSEHLKVHPVGVAAYDGTAAFEPPAKLAYVSYQLTPADLASDAAITAPVKRLATLLGELGHQRIDLLKLDIEGAEYDVIDDLLATRVEVRQLLVEFHHRWKHIGLERTRHAIRELNRSGFEIFFVSATGMEYGFANLGYAAAAD